MFDVWRITELSLWGYVIFESYSLWIKVEQDDSNEVILNKIVIKKPFLILSIQVVSLYPQASRGRKPQIWEAARA